MRRSEAERELAHLPKRATDLTRRGLIDLVDQIQVLLYGDSDGKKWNPNGEQSAADFLEAVDLIMGGKGLRPPDEFEGQEIEEIRL